jgi:uncharacterized repeat protein (TIGR03943 family)
MSRVTQHVVLVLVGLATAVMLVKGTYLNYVKPSLLGWLAVAAVVLVVLGLSGVVGELRGAAEGGHGHAHRSGLAWLLLVPIALVAFVVPPPLDARGTNPPPAAVSTPTLRPFPPLPPGPAPEVPLPEAVMRAAADSAHSLDGRTITLTGFTVHGSGAVDLGRVVIVCCAADAQLARVHLTGVGFATAADYPEDTWVRVTGRMRPGSSHVEDGFVPTMEVTEAIRIEKPKNAYAY